MKKSISIILSIIMLMQIAFAGSKVFAVGSEGTDFSNVKIETTLTSNTVYLNISNITVPETGYSYYYQITDTNTKPTINSKADFIQADSQWKAISPNTEKNGFSCIISDTMELNKDMFLWFYQVPNDVNVSDYYELISGYEIKHLTIPNTPELFFVTTLSYSWTNIGLNIPWGFNTVRKMNVKIGRVNDNNILNSIKNTESDCFSKLLTYAKSSESIYSNTLTSNKHNGYESNKEGASVIDLYSKITDKDYYYLYVALDDEDGKYYPVEGVTLAQASKYGADEDNHWYMFFYGDGSFNWDGLEGGTSNGGGQKEDPTVAKDPIPQTGQSMIIAGGIVLSVVAAFILIKKNSDYKEIR